MQNLKMISKNSLFKFYRFNLTYSNYQNVNLLVITYLKIKIYFSNNFKFTPYLKYPSKPLSSV